jgi:LEA14-like dessication related protein
MLNPRPAMAALIFLIASIVSGCATVTGDMDPPNVVLESFNSLPSDGGGPRFQIKLRVQNPNKQALDIAGISYSIALLDREVITGVTNEVPLIAPYSEEVVTLEAGFNLVQLLRLLTGMGRTQGDALEYRFAAKIDFNGFLPTQRVEETGEITLR